MGIKQYDTVKDRDGNRYRVTEVGSDGQGHVIAKLKGITPDNKSKRGPARIVDVNVLEEEYTRIDLPPVTVIQTKPVPDEKVIREIFDSGDPDAIDDLILADPEEIKSAETETEKLRVTASNLERQVRELGRENADLKKTVSKMKQAHESEVAELNDRIMELEIFKKQRTEYLEELDDDTEVFNEIRVLAEMLQSSAKHIHNAASLIGAKTEGKI